MQIKKEYITQKISDSQIMIATGSCADQFNGYVISNETAAYIIQQLRDDLTIDELTDRVLEVYDVEREKAKSDILMIIEKLDSIGAIEK